MKNTKLSFISISSKKININLNNILNLLGYLEVEKIDKSIIEKVNYYIKKCINICSPKGCFFIDRIIKMDKKKGNLKINEIILKIGNKIAAQLNNSEYLALFICTAGDEIEKYSKELMINNEYLESYIVDLLGSEIAEESANYIHQKINNKAKSMKLKITNRFSPGYCNWNVNEQFKLFNFFPDNPCNIKLTGGGLMKPIKSVSGIIGIGKNVKFRDYACEFCNFKECQFRVIKNKKRFNSVPRI